MFLKSLYFFSRFFKIDFVFSFPENSSYSFHWIALKLGGQFDHEMIQRIMF